MKSVMPPRDAHLEHLERMHARWRREGKVEQVCRCGRVHWPNPHDKSPFCSRTCANRYQEKRP